MASKLNKNKVIGVAQKYVQKGQYERAIKEYRKIIDDDPRDVRILLKIGDLFAKKGSVEEAVQTYLKVAEFYSEQGFYLKAVAVFKQILKLAPTLVEVNLKLAALYKQLGLLNDAMQQYELVSNHYNQQGRTKDALAAVRQIVDLDPENVASRIKLAELYSKEEMTEEAIEEFSKASDFLRASNRLDDFVKVAERLVFHQPDNIGVTKELASLYLRRQDPRRALQKLQLAFKADPRDDNTLGMLAQAFEDLGQIPKTVSVLKELAHIYRENGREDQCQETYRRVLTLAPDDAEACRALGQEPAAAAPVPNSTGPEPVYREEPEPPPPSLDDGPLDQPLAMSQPQVPPTSSGVPPGQLAEGEDVADFIVRILTEADVYIKYGLHDKAVDHLRQVFPHDPYNIEVRLKLKELHLLTGRYAEAGAELLAVAQTLAPTDRRAAAGYLNEAVELDPSNDVARQLLSNLETSSARPLPDRDPLAMPGAGDETLDEQYVDDQYVDDDSGVAAITLDADDIVEEIPIDSDDLLAADEYVVGMDPGPDAAREYIASPSELSAEYLSGSGIIELEPEQDTLSGPAASEVIRVPAEAGVALRGPIEDEDEDTTVEDDLEEADFFIQQGLFGEARAILDDLGGRFPHHPLVQSKRSELAEAEQGAAAEVGAEEDLGEHTDLAAELAAELDADVEVEPGPSIAVATYSVEDVFDEFKRGVDDQVSDEDSDTHYDLGIAYREMGLMDDAIAEFKVAMRSRDKEVLCHMMIGLCQSEKGLLSEAISQFKTGLYVEGITERETIALYFELGQAYEQLDDLREALYYYEKVGKKDPKFRDVASRIERLRRAAGSDDGGGQGGPPPSGHGSSRDEGDEVMPSGI